MYLVPARTGVPTSGIPRQSNPDSETKGQLLGEPTAAGSALVKENAIVAVARSDIVRMLAYFFMFMFGLISLANS